jgi:signal transduction histidine kinase
MVSTINRSAERMLVIVQNLLDVNMLDRNATQFAPELFDIMPLLISVADMYNVRGAEKNIAVHCGKKHSVLTVFANAAATEQVLDNIVSNAVKYSPLGKNVWVDCDINDAGNEVVVSVKDEGLGLSEDDMAKLFGKFARLSARPTGGEHSTGLGLSIVKKIVEMMQGRVWCESELGKGATFFVALPLSAVASSPEEQVHISFE